ncbi:MAG: hypothetical protein C4341_10080 [Armatimonadota bacterium]
MSHVAREQVETSRPKRPTVQEKHLFRCGPLRASKRGVWRAAVLISVHLVIAAHIAWWLVKGKAITPVEPSEAMQTLELGYLNAGFIFFVFAILATMVFGRFICGWACHVVAYQDLCGWILRKLGIRPHPFRSRLLIFVPLFAALYMFVWPQVLRIYEGRPFPRIVYHLQTEDFWATFPNWQITLLTIGVCGFLIVVLLGNKGFCTYGCPYGAFFGFGDRVAPGRIRVTDACDGCGHCTATCTSNVRVHEEVRLFKMVTDPGCMKCMDCVSVCPKDALYYGFGNVKPPADLRKNKPAAQKYDFALPEEFALIGLFLLTLYIYRGLYAAIPFLLSLGLASITAVLLVHSARLIYKPHVRLQRVQLKRDGRMTKAGATWSLLATLLLAFLSHSMVVQIRTHEAEASLALADSLYSSGKGADPQALEAARTAKKGYEWLIANGLFPVAEWEYKLASVNLYLGEVQPAERGLRRALAMQPSLHGAHRLLADALLLQGRPEEAAESLNAFLKQEPNDAAARSRLGLLLADLGRHAEAERQAQEALRLEPNNTGFRKNLALVLAQGGDVTSAIKTLQPLLQSDTSGDTALLAADMAAEIGDAKTEAGMLDRVRVSAPLNPALLRRWADAHRRAGSLNDQIRSLLGAQPDDTASWYALVFLYNSRGDKAQARALYERLLLRSPGLPPP